MKNITSQLKANERWYNYTKFLNTRNWNDTAINFALVDISPESYKPFYFGINIIDKIVNASEYNCGRAIWQSGEESMEWKTEKPLRSFDVIGIGAYMYFQLFGIPAFLFDNKIQPLAKFRTDKDPIIILGGQGFYMFNGYDKFIDIACIGEGEEWTLEILNICKQYKGNRKKIIEEAAKIEGSYCPSIHGTSPNEVIKKRIVAQENLKYSILDKNSIESKVTRKVIEIARGCKYNCGFCSLSKRMYPFRQNNIDDIIKNIDTFEAGQQIYPFAPDEASFDKHEELAKWCNYKGMKYFRYNFRLNTITENDVLTRNVSNQIVLGIDGVSQRIIDITDKKINMQKLLNEVAPLIFKQNYALLKLNYVFNYSFETDDDYKELEETWIKLIEMRIAANARTMIQIAPTPFIPEYFIPLQYSEIRPDINPNLERIYMKVKKYYFEERKITPMFKMQGLQGYKNWYISVMLHRLENLSDFVYYAFKNNYRKSSFGDKLYDLFIEYCRINKINRADLLKEIDSKEIHWFNKIDWSCGTLDYKNVVSNRWDKMKIKAYENVK